jgi:uncharacterized protein YkwD
MNHFLYISLLLFGLQPSPDSLQSQVPDTLLDHPIEINNYDPYLLERAILIATNAAREAHGLPPVAPHALLRQSATRTSLEQAETQRLSHTSVYPERRHLEDRIKMEGIDLVNVIIGENLGVDYILRIADHSFYIDPSTDASVPMDAETRQPILKYTYRQFGAAMVNHWLGSRGHRKNLLNPDFEWIGVGAVTGMYQDFESIYVTQHFLGRIKPPNQSRLNKTVNP